MSRFEFSRVEPSAWPKAEGRIDISSIDGAVVPGAKLEVYVGPRKIGGRYLRVSLYPGVGRGRGTRISFLHALFNDGRYPGQNWIEVIDLDLPPGIEPEPGFEGRLAPYLTPVAAVIPPGGHLMVEYENPMWSETQRGLLVGIPPLATPLGALLYEIGCGDSFKDWYFPEGGQEGGRKLQGNRAFTPTQGNEMAARRAEELGMFLAGPRRGPEAMEGRARARADRILLELKG